MPPVLRLPAGPFAEWLNGVALPACGGSWRAVGLEVGVDEATLRRAATQWATVSVGIVDRAVVGWGDPGLLYRLYGDVGLVAA